MIKKYILLFGVLMTLGLSSTNASTLSGTELLDCEDECEKLFSQLKKYASHGSPQAQTLLALAYKSGEGVEINNDSAWRWIRRAYRQSFPPASHIVSKWYRQGFNTDIDVETADRHLRDAAERDYGPAILDLGILNYQRNNEVLAAELIDKAAKMGSSKAKSIIEEINPKEIHQFDKVNLKESLPSPIRNAGNYDGDENTLTIIGQKDEPIVILTKLLLDVKAYGFYDQRGTTGSRLSDRKCTGGAQGAAFCSVIMGRDLSRQFILF